MSMVAILCDLQENVKSTISVELLALNDQSTPGANVIAISLFDPTRHQRRQRRGKTPAAEKQSKLRAALEEVTSLRGRIIESVHLSPVKAQREATKPAT